MPGFTTNLNRLVARQEKKIKALEAKISEQDAEISRLTQLNTRLMTDQQNFASENAKVELVKKQYEDGIEEMKSIREKYQQAIFEARKIKKEYLVRFKQQVKRMRKED